MSRRTYRITQSGEPHRLRLVLPYCVKQAGESAMRPELESLVGLVYDAALEPAAWPEAMPRIAAFVGAEAAVLAHIPSDRIWLGDVWTHELDAGVMAAFRREGIITRSAYVQASTTIRPGKVDNLRAYGRGEMIVTDPWVAAVLAPLDLLEGHHAALLHDGGFSGSLICLNRSRTGQLPPDCVARMRALLPHLRRALAIRRRVEVLRDDAGLLRAALAKIAVGLVIVTADLRVLIANAEAERVFAENDGLKIVTGRLRVADITTAKALAEQVAGIGRTAAGESFLNVVRPSAKPPLTLCIGPAPSRRGAAACIFITDPESPAVLPPARALAARFGLTDAEAEVARLAASGCSAPAAASALDISVNTVRTHLKAVYSKTDVHSQSALICLIEASFPPIRSPDGAHGLAIPVKRPGTRNERPP